MAPLDDILSGVHRSAAMNNLQGMTAVESSGGGAAVVTVMVECATAVSERRFSRQLSVYDLKCKLEPITGCPVGQQVLTVLANSAGDKVLESLDDDSRPLYTFASLQDFVRLRVTAKSGSEWQARVASLTDVSKIAKYEMDDTLYEQRQDSVRAFKQRHKLGRFADKMEQDEEQLDASPFLDSQGQIIELGQRCLVLTDPKLPKRGTVLFVGCLANSKTRVVGVAYDEKGQGRHDGEREGVRYFTCEPGCGALVKPHLVVVGDFARLDEEDDMEGLDEL